MGYIRQLLVAGVLTTLTAFSVNAADLDPPSHYLVDLSDNHWCYECVTTVVDEHGLLNGYMDHTFRGDWEVNRFALAAAVAKTFNKIQLKEGIEFKAPLAKPSRNLGVSPDHWAFPYIRKLASENGLMSRYYASGNFQGDTTVTRAELAYGLSEFLAYLEATAGWDFSPERREIELASDVSKNVPESEYIELALNRYRFMNLYSDHSFRPDKPVTRYALAAALCRVMELFETPVKTAQN